MSFQTVEAKTYWARGWDEDRQHGHAVLAASPEDAAMTFAELWAPSVATATLTVLVSDAEDGCELCFLVDLDSGDARAC